MYSHFEALPSKKLVNMARKRQVFARLCCLLLVFSLAGFAFSTPADVQPQKSEIFIMSKKSR